MGEMPLVGESSTAEVFDLKIAADDREGVDLDDLMEASSGRADEWSGTHSFEAEFLEEEFLRNEQVEPQHETDFIDFNDDLVRTHTFTHTFTHRVHKH